MRIPIEVITVATALGELRERVVFVGGMARSMLISDPAVAGPRPTKDLQDYLKKKIRSLLENPAFLEALPGHLPPDEASQARLPLVIHRLNEIATMKEDQED